MLFLFITSLVWAQEPDQQFQGFNLQGYTDTGDKSWDVKGDTADINGSEIILSNVNANTYGDQKMNVTAQAGTIDQVNGATIGQASGDKPTIKASTDFGLFGGILSKLPPEIRRAGRDVLQTAKRSLPIGRVTGGRLFPPFG